LVGACCEVARLDGFPCSLTILRLMGWLEWLISKPSQQYLGTPAGHVLVQRFARGYAYGTCAGTTLYLARWKKTATTSLGNPTKLALPPRGAVFVFHALGDRMPDKGIFREVVAHMVQPP
jgi:hypothetical protein